MELKFYSFAFGTKTEFETGREFRFDHFCDKETSLAIQQRCEYRLGMISFIVYRK